MMTDSEFAAEITSLTNVIAELEEIARALSNELAPVKRREEDIRRRIIATYRHRRREDDDQDEVLGFRGEIKPVMSTRIVAVRHVGDDRQFDYAEVEAVVLVPDPSAAMARMLLYDERDRLAEQYGHQRNRERDCYADIEQARRTRDRLHKARDVARERLASKPQRKEVSNDRQSTLF
jgi:hypothetical protein